MRRCEWCDKEFTPVQPTQRFCSGNHRKRACADAHRARCAECGGALQEGSGWKGGDRCGKCRSAELDKGQWRRRRTIELMWEDGEPVTAIAEAIGWSSVGAVRREINEMRAAGWGLPYRYKYSEDGIARISAAVRRLRAEEKARRQAA